MKNRYFPFNLSCIVFAFILSIAPQTIFRKSVSASQEFCQVRLLRNDVVIQEISEPIKPEAPASEDRRETRQYERLLEQYERRLERFTRRLIQFRERVERSQQRNNKLSISFNEYCEDYVDMDGENTGDNSLPSLESLTPGTRLYAFVSNPNVQIDENGNYFIDYNDPNYIDTGEAYTQGESVPDDPGVIIRVNFGTRKAIVEIGDASMDISNNFFADLDSTP